MRLRLVNVPGGVQPASHSRRAVLLQPNGACWVGQTGPPQAGRWGEQALHEIFNLCPDKEGRLSVACSYFRGEIAGVFADAEQMARFHLG